MGRRVHLQRPPGNGAFGTRGQGSPVCPRTPHSVSKCPALPLSHLQRGKAEAKPTIVQACLGDPDHEAGIGGTGECQAQGQCPTRHCQALRSHPSCPTAPLPGSPPALPLYPCQNGNCGEVGVQTSYRGASPQSQGFLLGHRPAPQHCWHLRQQHGTPAPRGTVNTEQPWDTARAKESKLWFLAPCKQTPGPPHPWGSCLHRGCIRAPKSWGALRLQPWHQVLSQRSPAWRGCPARQEQAPGAKLLEP